MPFFDGSLGRIHHTAWLPDGDVRAVVVFCHGGFGEHLGLYEELGRRLPPTASPCTRWTPSATAAATASAT